MTVFRCPNNAFQVAELACAAGVVTKLSSVNDRLAQ